MIISLLFGYLFSDPKFLLIVAAVIPALVLLIYVYRRDRIEKEPGSLLLSLVLWGIVFAVFSMPFVMILITPHK